MGYEYYCWDLESSRPGDLHACISGVFCLVHPGAACLGEMNANSVGTRGSDPSITAARKTRQGCITPVSCLSPVPSFFLFFLLEIFFDAVFAFFRTSASPSEKLGIASYLDKGR
ncbi:hypothetical protein BJX62DRAFT_48441 [Aspergillus germanicus]